MVVKLDENKRLVCSVCKSIHFNKIVIDLDQGCYEFKLDYNKLKSLADRYTEVKKSVSEFRYGGAPRLYNDNAQYCIAKLSQFISYITECCYISEERNAPSKFAVDWGKAIERYLLSALKDGGDLFVAEEIAKSNLSFSDVYGNVVVPANELRLQRLYSRVYSNNDAYLNFAVCCRCGHMIEIRREVLELLNSNVFRKVSLKLADTVSLHDDSAKKGEEGRCFRYDVAKHVVPKDFVDAWRVKGGESIRWLLSTLFETVSLVFEEKRVPAYKRTRRRANRV